MPGHIKAAFLAVLLALPCRGAVAADGPPLVLEATIPLENTGGRIDHMAVDLRRQRLFVAELGNGTVDVVDETEEVEFMGGRCRRISIFLNVFNVHVQRAPVSGKIVYQKHTEGEFVSATRSDCGEHNENVLLGFTPEEFPNAKLGVRLIAGLIARRIIVWAGAGEEVERSERISLIQFGSRADVYLPLEVKINCKLGDKVKGGETVLATFK